MSAADEPQLQRAVSRWQIVGLSINDVVGSGIYLLPAATVALLGPFSLWGVVAAGIVAHHRAQQRRGPEGLHVEGHVGGPAEALFGALDIDDGYGRLGREAAGAAPHVGIDHHVAHDEDAQLIELLK